MSTPKNPDSLSSHIEYLRSEIIARIDGLKEVTNARFAIYEKDLERFKNIMVSRIEYDLLDNKINTNIAQIHQKVDLSIVDRKEAVDRATVIIQAGLDKAERALQIALDKAEKNLQLSLDVVEKRLVTQLESTKRYTEQVEQVANEKFAKVEQSLYPIKERQAWMSGRDAIIAAVAGVLVTLVGAVALIIIHYFTGFEP